MSTIAEITSELRQLGVRKDQIDSETERIRSEIFPLNRQRIAASNRGDTNTAQALAQQLASLRQQRDALFNEREQIDSQQDRLNAELQRLQQQLAQTPAASTASPPVQQQIAQQQPNNPAQSPPQVLNNNQVVTPSAATAPTNAVIPSTQSTGDVDVGTNAPVRTLDQTQSVNSSSSQTATGAAPFVSADTGEIPGVTVSNRDATDPGFVPNGASQPGAGPSDDAGTASSTQAQTNANASGEAVSTDAPITPRPNVLDRFASYNYQAAVYMLTPAQLDTFQNQTRKSVNGYNLLFQSGGAPRNQQGPQQPTGEPQQDGRNPYFDQDFYIDSITFENRLFGKATMASHSVATLKFTVIEPSNITLIDRLYAAAQDLAPQDATGAINYAAVTYLMVIRFYGQDINGKLQRVGAADPRTGLTDADAVVEKFIPFRIKNINWSVASRLVSYEFDCAPQDQLIALGTRRGTIPADVEISGATVESMLAGARVFTGTSPGSATPGASTSATADQSDAETARLARQNAAAAAPAPGNAAAAPTNGRRSIKQGLITAMNDSQQQLVQKGIYNYADVYEIAFANGAESIASATVTKPGKKTNKRATPVAPAPSRQPSSASPDKQNMDVTARNFGITAGMSVVQAIDLIIRNSNYITDQATVVIDETTGQPVPNPKSNTKGIKWFNILAKTTQLQYDTKRNDFAYRIQFIIVPYIPVDFTSLYFPPAQFRGVHKRYPWWFTGENTQVLDYTATFNKLYNLTVTAGTLEGNALDELRRNQSSSMRDIPFYQHQARSTESESGAGTKANEVGANAAEYLYNPSDNANAKVRILGDPAWIQQGSIAGGASVQSLSYAAFEPDGSINFDTNDVMFEIVWQRPEDYDLGTGLADPYGRTQKIFGDRTPIQSVVYRARSVTSEFRGGKFEQVLDGTLYLYPVPEGTNRAAGSPASQTNGRSNGAAGDTAGADSNAARSSAPTSTALASAAAGADSAGAARIGQNTPNGFSDLAAQASQVNAAKFNNYGSAGALLESATKFSPSPSSGEFAALLPQGAASLLPASPALPVTSNGAAVGPTAADFAEAQRIQRASGDPEAITAQQVASNRRLNNSLTGVLGFPVLPNPNQPTDSGTAVIARDT